MIASWRVLASMDRFGLLFPCLCLVCRRDQSRLVASCCEAVTPKGQTPYGQTVEGASSLSVRPSLGCSAHEWASVVRASSYLCGPAVNSLGEAAVAYVPTYTYISIYTQVHIYIYIYIYMHIPALYMYIDVHRYISLYIHVHISVHMLWHGGLWRAVPLTDSP